MKKIYLLSFLLLFLVSCKSGSGIITAKKNVSELKKGAGRKKGKAAKIKVSKLKEVIDFDDTEYVLDQIVGIAGMFEGVRYRGGGTNSKGMDCSGLIYTAFGNYDIKMPRRSIDMSKEGRKVKVEDAKKGDLIFFTTSRRKVINHVGIITQVTGEEVVFLHASSSRGVMYSSLNEPYFQRTFAQINRVIE